MAMERVKKMRRARQVVGDTCMYVISIVSVVIFMVEIMNWMMTV